MESIGDSMNQAIRRIEMRRQEWDQKRSEMPGEVCDEYPFMCAEVLLRLQAIDYRTGSCRCIDEARGRLDRSEARRMESEAYTMFGAIPGMHRRQTFASYVLNPDWHYWEVNSARKARAVCLEYAADPAARPFLTLYGEFGAGKTHLAAAIANEVDLKVLWANVPDMIQHLQAHFGDGFDLELDAIKRAPLLVLDDLHAEYGKRTKDDRQTWKDSQLYAIVDYRYSREMPTVITTNLDRGKWNGRVESRLQDWHTGQVVQLHVQDNRKMLERYEYEAWE